MPFECLSEFSECYCQPGEGEQRPFRCVSFAPSGLDQLSTTYPRLAPWAAFFRRFAAAFFPRFAAGYFHASRLHFLSPLRCWALGEHILPRFP